MSERVTFGDSSGVLVLPEGSARTPAIVVIHEWWGLNPQIQTVAERWAKEGFVALVPDLFHGNLPKTTDEAQAAMAKLDFPRAVGERVASVEYLKTHPRSNGKVAVTGYCLGGALAFLAATAAKGLAAVVPFYGLPPQADWAKVEAPIQAHFAKQDDWATVDGAKQVQAALAAREQPMELHVYDAGHAFCRDTDPEVYNAACASQAWSRAVTFAKQHTA
jgi:carboxymethylenebutenolidase